MTTNSPPQDTRSQWLGAMTLVTLGLIFIWRSLADLPLGTITDPGPAAAPLLLASLLIACALWSLLGRASGLLGRADTDDNAAEPGSLRHALLITAAAVFAALALGPLGYRLTILAILLFFLALVERKPIVAVLLVSFALSFGSFALFERVLKIPLPIGPLGI
jgi:hypothetical protein